MCKIYMSRKVRPIVTRASLQNKMAILSHVKRDYPIKKALSQLSMLTGVPNVKTT